MRGVRNKSRQGKYLWLDNGTRLTYVRSNDGKNFNWLFLPGGPGIGSEYFDSLVNELTVSGNIWLVDFPGNGSNVASKNYNFNQWKRCLLETVQLFDNVILVGHSFGGAFALFEPAIEKYLSGLVLMNAYPNMQWRELAQQYGKEHRLPSMDKIRKAYDEHPSDKEFKKIAMNTPFFFTKESQKMGREIYRKTPMAHLPFEWAKKCFNPFYEAKWIPRILTLILGGEKDFLTPIKLFKEDRRFNKKNIKIKTIKNASHHPWVEACEAVQRELIEFKT